MARLIRGQRGDNVRAHVTFAVGRDWTLVALVRMKWRRKVSRVQFREHAPTAAAHRADRRPVFSNSRFFAAARFQNLPICDDLTY